MGTRQCEIYFTRRDVLPDGTIIREIEMVAIIREPAKAQPQSDASPMSKSARRVAA